MLEVQKQALYRSLCRGPENLYTQRRLDRDANWSWIIFSRISSLASRRPRCRPPLWPTRRGAAPVGRAGMVARDAVGGGPSGPGGHRGPGDAVGAAAVAGRGMAARDAAGSGPSGPGRTQRTGLPSGAAPGGRAGMVARDAVGGAAPLGRGPLQSRLSGAG